MLLIDDLCVLVVLLDVVRLIGVAADFGVGAGRGLYEGCC